MHYYICFNFNDLKVLEYWNRTQKKEDFQNFEKRGFQPKIRRPEPLRLKTVLIPEISHTNYILPGCFQRAFWFYNMVQVKKEWQIWVQINQGCIWTQMVNVTLLTHNCRVSKVTKTSLGVPLIPKSWVKNAAFCWLLYSLNPLTPGSNKKVTHT